MGEHVTRVVNIKFLCKNPKRKKYLAHKNLKWILDKQDMKGVEWSGLDSTVSQ